MRASGFLSSAASTMAARLPLLPPMKTASGAGRSERASGASPSTRTRFRVLNFSRLALMSAQPSGLHSTAYTRPRGAANASSTLTLPVPAPTSHRMSPGRTASFASTAARTSCLVMGTSPRSKASSGRPGARRGSTSAASTRRTLRLLKRPAASSLTLPRKSFSSGVPRHWPTTPCTSPKPSAASWAQRVAGSSLPPVRKKVGLPCIHSATGSQVRPWAETRFHPCHGRPSAAASSWMLERPGSTRARTPRASSFSIMADAPE